MASSNGKEWDERTKRWSLPLPPTLFPPYYTLLFSSPQLCSDAPTALYKFILTLSLIPDRVFYNLKEEAELVGAMDEKHYVSHIETEGDSSAAEQAEKDAHQKIYGEEGAAPAEKKPAKQVKETKLYDALEIAPDATSSQVKKAYYKMAKKHHPDHNLGDEGAKARFQEISDAYQVLSDEGLREKYDVQGMDGLGETPKMDPQVFYTMFFGSEEFEPLIGVMKV